MRQTTTPNGVFRRGGNRGRGRWTVVYCRAFPTPQLPILSSHHIFFIASVGSLLLELETNNNSTGLFLLLVFQEGGNRGEYGRPRGRGGGIHRVRGASGDVLALGPGSPQISAPARPIAPPLYHPEKGHLSRWDAERRRPLGMQGASAVSPDSLACGPRVRPHPGPIRLRGAPPSPWTRPQSRRSKGVWERWRRGGRVPWLTHSQSPLCAPVDGCSPSSSPTNLASQNNRAFCPVR